MRADGFFDTNILVYAISEQSLKKAVGERLLLGGGVVSVQVLNEFVAVARRKLKLEWGRVQQDLKAIQALVAAPAPITLEVHRTAFELARNDGLHIYDANIVAAALLAGCTTLYTEDMQDGRRFGPLTVRNPFAAQAAPSSTGTP